SPGRTGLTPLRLRLGVGERLEDGDALSERRVGVEEAVEPALVVLQRVVDAHGRRRVVELLEGLVVLLELLEGTDQAFGVAAQLDAADVGQLPPAAGTGRAYPR